MFWLYLKRFLARKCKDIKIKFKQLLVKNIFLTVSAIPLGLEDCVLEIPVVTLGVDTCV